MYIWDENAEDQIVSSNRWGTVSVKVDFWYVRKQLLALSRYQSTREDFFG